MVSWRVSQQLGIHKIFSLPFNCRVLRLLLRGLKIKRLYWAEDLASASQRVLSKGNIDADPRLILMFYPPSIFYFQLRVMILMFRTGKDRAAAVMLHHCPCDKLCSSRSEHPDPDLLTQVPGLTSKLPGCDGCAW